MRGTAKPYMVRLYKAHRKAIKKAARRQATSEAHIIRTAIERHCA